MNRRRAVLLGISILWTWSLASMPVKAAGGPATTDPNRPAGRPVVQLTKGTLHQAVEKAKSGDPNGIHLLSEEIQHGWRVPSKDLSPELRACLKDPDPEVQFLGVQGLHVLKDPSSKADLVTFLSLKDLHGWKKRIQTAKDGTETQRLFWEVQVSIGAVLILGEIGDKSAIPVLESLRSAELEWEMGPPPVEVALAKLGADGIRSLAKAGPKADPKEIERASKGIRAIRDPKMIPALVATVKDTKAAPGIRAAALEAMGDMNDVNEVLPFALATLKDLNYPRGVRATALYLAAKTRHPATKTILEEVYSDPNSDVHRDCLYALSSLDPNTYQPIKLIIILDRKAPIEEREDLARSFTTANLERVRPHVELIRQGLQALESDGTPADSIRISMWKALNRATGERPTLELKNPKMALLYFSYDIEQRVLKQNDHARAAEVRSIVESEVNSFVVQWQSGKAGVKP